MLGEAALDELPELLYWARIDPFDRAAVNRPWPPPTTEDASVRITVQVTVDTRDDNTEPVVREVFTLSAR